MKSDPKILIVEDGIEMSNLLMDVLDSSGYQTIHAAEGKMAVKMALDEKPDLILLDIMLPDLDGLEVCRAIRTHPKTSHIKVLVVSALNGKKDMHEALLAGALGYLTKPFDIAHLLDKVKATLQTN